MLYFLSGEDEFRVRERETEIALDFQKKEADAERHVFHLDEEWTTRQTSELLEAVSGGLFTVPRIILLRQASALSEEAAGSVKEIVGRALEIEDVLVVATHRGKMKKTHPLIAWLLKYGESENFLLLDNASLARYGEALLKKIDAEISIEASALARLTSNVGTDTGKLFQELSKLASYTKKGKIALADVELLSDEPLESNVFAALDALVQGKRGEAIVLLRREEKMSVPIQKTLGLCAWQLRKLIEVEELYSSGLRQAGAIASVLKSSPYPIQKLLPRLSAFKPARLRHGMTLLADLDLAIRSGKAQPGIALDLFIWKF